MDVELFTTDSYWSKFSRVIGGKCMIFNSVVLCNMFRRNYVCKFLWKKGILTLVITLGVKLEKSSR